MKKIILAMILLVAGVCCAQQPVYNPTAGTFTWTISEDTTQPMTGCIGNNYNAEGHTGRVSSTTQVTGVQAEDEAAGCDLVDYFLSKATVDLKFAIEARVTELRNLGYDVVVQGLTFNGEVAA